MPFLKDGPHYVIIQEFVGKRLVEVVHGLDEDAYVRCTNKSPPVGCEVLESRPDSVRRCKVCEELVAPMMKSPPIKRALKARKRRKDMEGQTMLFPDN
jgi:hypothetical protein